MSYSPESNQEAYAPTTMPPEKKHSCGCVAWGCLGVTLLAVAGVLGLGFGGYWFLTGQVEKYTSPTPTEIPTVQLSEEEMAELDARIESFRALVEPPVAASTDEPSDASTEQAAAPAEQAAAPAGDETDGSDSADASPAVPPTVPTELVLTADELNALIAREPDLRGRVFMRLEDGNISGDVSIPTDMFPGGRGRFLNASASFEASMENGVLIVRMTDATVKGEPLPEQFLQGLSQQNLAKDMYEDPETAEMLRKFESVRVEGDRLILKLRPQDQPEAAEPPAAETPPADAP